MNDKFSQQDRELVIKELERIQRTTLSPIRPLRKLFKDDAGKYYCVFGGKEDWHGISADLIQQLERHPDDTLLVIAKKYRTRLDICVATVEKLIANKNKLFKTKRGGYQFHTILTEDGMYLEEVPKLYLKKISEIAYAVRASARYDLSEVKKIINVEMLPDESINKAIEEGNLTHSDIQAKLIVIGNLLGYRTFTPDKSAISRYGKLGDLCSEVKIPSDYVPLRQINTVKNIDVIWFDIDGLPTHCFEVEHTTDITKGLLRLYQIRKLRIKMFIVAKESSRNKYSTELNKDPFYHIKEEFIFRTYSELKDFLDSVKRFALLKGAFLNEQK
jgi:hypothetical protein